jgi:predicted amidohydrolase YtcJ
MSALLHDDQIPLTFAWRDLRAHAPRLCFSTDWPVIGVEVMPSVKAAVAPLDLGAPWRDQSQNLIDTLKSYTADNAWMEFNEHRKGMLKPGIMADIVVMSDDLEEVEPHALDQTRAALTLCAGRVTWEA